MFLAIGLILIFVLLPENAYGWGPATHLEYSTYALTQLAAFSPLVKRLLQKYRNHFLYGSIAADITLGKGAKGYLYNCHNWHVAFNIMKKKAKKDSQRAFMLGYLSHLAADTVAHNFFVPYKLIRSWNNKKLIHAYWEMRMDLTVPSECWQLFDDLRTEEFAEDDKLLEDYLATTFFSFKTNKTIFNGLMVVQRLKNYKNMVLKVADPVSWDIAEKDVKVYKSLAKKAVVDFLKNLESSFCLEADATGKLKMLYARDMIAGFKKADKANQLDEKLEQKILSDVKLNLKKGIYKTTSLPSVEDFLL